MVRACHLALEQRCEALWLRAPPGSRGELPCLGEYLETSLRETSVQNEPSCSVRRALDQLVGGVVRGTENELREVRRASLGLDHHHPARDLASRRIRLLATVGRAPPPVESAGIASLRIRRQVGSTRPRVTPAPRSARSSRRDGAQSRSCRGDWRATHNSGTCAWFDYSSLLSPCPPSRLHLRPRRAPSALRTRPVLSLVRVVSECARMDWWGRPTRSS